MTSFLHRLTRPETWLACMTTRCASWPTLPACYVQVMSCQGGRAGWHKEPAGHNCGRRPSPPRKRLYNGLSFFVKGLPAGINGRLRARFEAAAWQGAKDLLKEPRLLTSFPFTAILLPAGFSPHILAGSRPKGT